MDPYCSCGEENLLAYPGDPYAAENILIHEFAHNIHLRGMVNVDATFDTRLSVCRHLLGVCSFCLAPDGGDLVGRHDLSIMLTERL